MRCKKDFHCSIHPHGSDPVHYYEVLSEYPEALVEYCVKCKHKVIWHKKEGKVLDAYGYGEAHIADLYQPGTPMYDQHYTSGLRKEATKNWDKEKIKDPN